LYGEREKMVGVYLVKSLFYMEVQYSVRFWDYAVERHTHKLDPSSRLHIAEFVCHKCLKILCLCQGYLEMWSVFCMQSHWLYRAVLYIARCCWSLVLKLSCSNLYYTNLYKEHSWLKQLVCGKCWIWILALTQVIVTEISSSLML
jgi:hypothetical protein